MKNLIMVFVMIASVSSAFAATRAKTTPAPKPAISKVSPPAKEANTVTPPCGAKAPVGLWACTSSSNCQGSGTPVAAANSAPVVRPTGSSQYKVR